MTDCIQEATTHSMSAEAKTDLLKTMILARQCDIREKSLIRQGKGWFHIAGTGHEAVAAIALSLEEGDYSFPYYRDRAFVLAQNYNSYDIALSFFGKKKSSSAGRQLMGHYSSRKHNVWSLLSPVAAHLLPAVGTAWGIQMDNKKKVVVVSVGEASTRQGDFYEAVCFAKERNLPVIFVVEDGKVSISTLTETMNPLLSLDVFSKDDWQVLDGCDANAVYAAGKTAIDKARNGFGPSFLWLQVDRICSHSSADDHRNYRSKEELCAIEANDPISRLKAELVAQGTLTEAEIEAIENNLKERVTDEYKRAEQEEDPQPGDEHEQVTAPLGKPEAPTHLKAGESYRMADAINETFKHSLKHNAHTLFFGQDIEDPLGGVFKLTKGLSSAYPTRVFNSPLAESSILGIACGLASYGKFPIFEIQFIDFIFPGWNQLINNLANLRWRSYGDWSCPCIIYAPYGGYLPAGGMWHSQAQESAMAHFPGMNVVIPSTPEDAAGLILTAQNCKDPTIILMPKHLLWINQTTPKASTPVPIGKACIRKTGTELTLVSWGNCLELSEKAIKEYPNPDAIELIDLRSISPWDEETIQQSVQKTGRLLVVQEDGESCSVGQMIISKITASPHTWNALKAPPQLVSKKDVPIGFNPVYEYSALPSKEKILTALETLLTTIHTEREAFAITGVQSHHPYLLSKADAPTPQTQECTVEIKETTVHIKVPNLGEGLLEARVIHLFKQPGDKVSADEPLCEVETDKAIFPIESAHDGVLQSWSVEEDDQVQVGQDIAILSIKEADPKASEPVPMPTLDAKQNNKALSAEILQQMQGVLPASLTVNAKIDSIKAARTGRNRAITSSIIIAWCVTRALEENPSFCRLLRGSEVSNVQETFDLGIAVALDNDVLETAVISNANDLSWEEFVQSYKDAIKATKAGERQSKSRTPLIISSMSSYHIRSGSPIVVPPAMTVLFAGASFYEHFSTPQGPALHEVISLCITFDHRWVNGAGGASFLNDMKKQIEQFEMPKG